MVKNLADVTYKTARRIVIALVGGTVLLLGIAMLVLPGPAMVVIPVGLAILGIEFAWARHFLTKIRDKGEDALKWVSLRRNKAASCADAGAGQGDPGTGDDAEGSAS